MSSTLKSAKAGIAMNLLFLSAMVVLTFHNVISSTSEVNSLDDEVKINAPDRDFKLPELGLSTYFGIGFIIYLVISTFGKIMKYNKLKKKANGAGRWSDDLDTE